MRNNPITISNYIRRNFADFVNSTYVVEDEIYGQQLHEQMDSLALFHGPYLHTDLPFKKGKSVRELVRETILSESFLKLGDIQPDRKLYLHQESAVRRAAAGHSLVVTTGTGSGKTESFLYPVLNYILSLIENGNKGIGIKAIFLYPMNALVNDQRSRLRKILADYPQITFGSYTGDTVERKKDVDLDKVRAEEGCDIPENELLSREEIRATPPDILFTNYSMLEYLLLRPTDFNILRRGSMNQWQFMVLDEAHTYKGTLGIEISMLLKRLMGTAGRKPQFILTSATLGNKDAVNDIITFAHNLTSQKYEPDDVIFSERESLNAQNIQYSILPDDYLQLKKKLDSPAEFRNLAGKYNKNLLNVSYPEALYELLKHDKNIYLLFDAIGGTASYSDVKQRINEKVEFDDEQLTTLIQLVSLACKNDNTTLYDAKFHLFVSSPHRAYITLGDDRQFRFGNQTSINGKKAFEVGSCRNCNNLYVIGQIKDNHLESDDSVDVYENYDKDIDANLDFFTLRNDDEDEDQTEYTICSKCGQIWETANINAERCTCGEQYWVKLYYVHNEHSAKKNNLVKCAYCGAVNTNAGIVQRFDLNKDQATSILAQIFYEGMGEEREPVDVQDADTEDIFSDTAKDIAKKSHAKQLLAFSDSRQQASYFSVAFQYQHNRFLRTRLVWELVKDHDGILVNQLIPKLTNLIRNGNYFDSHTYDDPSVEAWISVLSDIMLLGGTHSSEGNALYYYEYLLTPVSEEQLKRNESSIRSLFKLDLDEFKILIQYVIHRFRENRAVNYQSANIPIQKFKDVFQYGYDESFYVLKKETGDKSLDRYIHSFLPVNGKSKSNSLIEYLAKIEECSYEEANDLAEKLFILLKNLHLINEARKDGMTGLYQISAENFRIHPYSKKKWYICSRCKKITPYNIHHVCPEKDCGGTLVSCDPDQARKDDYYRHEYMTIPIEKVVIEEHTAQLQRDKAREYQKKFKEGKINILSSSTTFEMGVDIGSLENVFLRNVPPTPANYVQRAGRAGRSKDAAALVVTYCGNNSHDFTYYNHPYELINGSVNPPLFSVSNAKIVVRHILATAFSFFFRQYPDEFKDIEKLLYTDGMAHFKEYLLSRPADLGSFVDQNILPGTNLHWLQNFGWLNEIQRPESKLNLFINEKMGELQRMREAESTSAAAQEYSEAEYFKRRIHDMSTESVIAALSENAVIPKYGFPVDVVGLDVMGKYRKDTDINLQRDLSIAISEYAPGSEVIVDGQKYVSRYINVPRKGGLKRYFYYECPNCGNLEISDTPIADMTECPICKTVVHTQNRYFIEPDLGFSTDKFARRSRTARPIKTYSSKAQYIGGGEKDQAYYDYRSSMHIESYKNDKLAIINENSFYYCPVCGYTKVDRTSYKNAIHEKHNTPFNAECSNDKLEHIALGHVFSTDVVKIHLNISAEKDEMITLAFAILEGMSHYLQIERSDINGLVIAEDTNRYAIILYDNVPGGAGYVKQIMNDDVMDHVLRTAQDIVNQPCCDDETTCYKCLRNYYNQSYHKQMKKKYAKRLLSAILGGIK